MNWSDCEANPVRRLRGPPHESEAGVSAYAASKDVMEAFMRVLARELRGAI